MLCAGEDLTETGSHGNENRWSRAAQAAHPKEALRDGGEAAPHRVPHGAPHLRPGHRRRRTAARLAHASTLSKDLKGSLDDGNKTEAAKKVGRSVAKICISKKIDKVVFDRNGYLYHGRVSALADAAREGGLKF